MSNEDTISKSNETIINEKKKNKLIIPLITTILLLIIIGAFGFYINMTSKPKKVISNLINTLYNSYKKTNDYYKLNLQDKPYIIDGNLNIITDIPYIEELNQEKFNYKIGIDSTNKKMLTEFNLMEDENKIISLIYYFLNTESYLKLDEYEKLIKLDEENTYFDSNITYNSENLNMTNEDLDYIIKEAKEILINSIDMSAFTKTKDKIKINDKETSVNKYTIELNEKNLKNLDTNFKTNIIKNKNLIKKLSELTNKTEDEIIESIKTTNNYQNSGKFNIYTTKFKNDIKMIEYSYMGNKIQITFDKEIKNITIKSGISSIEFDIKKYTKEEMHIDFSLSYGFPIKGYIKTNIKNSSKEELNYTTTININYLNYNFGIKNEINIEEVNELYNIDTTNYVDANTIDPNEMNNIMENLLTKYQNSNLFKIIQNLSMSEQNELM